MLFPVRAHQVSLYQSRFIKQELVSTQGISIYNELYSTFKNIKRICLKNCLFKCLIAYELLTQFVLLLDFFPASIDINLKW